jgi:hypothetical protein
LKTKEESDEIQRDAQPLGESEQKRKKRKTKKNGLTGDIGGQGNLPGRKAIATRNGKRNARDYLDEFEDGDE